MKRKKKKKVSRFIRADVTGATSEPPFPNRRGCCLFCGAPALSLSLFFTLSHSTHLALGLERGRRLLLFWPQDPESKGKGERDAVNCGMGSQCQLGAARCGGQTTLWTLVSCHPLPLLLPLSAPASVLVSLRPSTPEGTLRFDSD